MAIYKKNNSSGKSGVWSANPNLVSWYLIKFFRHAIFWPDSLNLLNLLGFFFICNNLVLKRIDLLWAPLLYHPLFI